MAASYPDVIGEYIDAPERFATGGLQYAGYFDPKTIAPEQVTNLYLFLQNTYNVPLEAHLNIKVPQSGGFLQSKKPLLQVEQPQLELNLAGAEVGLLTIPVTTTGHTESGTHPLTIEVKASTQGKGQRIRPAKSKSRLDNTFIDSPIGLNLVASLGATYAEKSTKKAEFPLQVAGQPNPPERAPKMQHSYQPVWSKDSHQFFNKAVQELNLREIKLRNELNVEALYVTLYAESTRRFADAGLPLRIGEAIILAKILTYSAQYFLSSANRRNGLLVPIWEHAFEMEVDTTDSLEVIRSVGYYHLLKLSLAISFGIIAKVFKRHFWSREERVAVTTHVAESIDMGQPLDIEFLYLPLLMAGTQIAGKVKLQGEDPNHTLALIKKARQARANLFIDDDMATADRVYNRILQNAA